MGDDFILDAVVSVGVHIPVALEATGDVDNGSAGDGFQVRDVLSFPGGDVEPGAVDYDSSVASVIGSFGDDGETSRLAWGRDRQNANSK